MSGRGNAPGRSGRGISIGIVGARGRGASAETAGIVARTNRGTKLIKGRGSAPVSNGNTGSVGTVETRVGSDSEGMSEGGNKMSSLVKRS